MLISYSESERRSVISSSWMSLYGGTMDMGLLWHGSGLSSNGVALWLERRQNGDAVEWWGEWVGWRFYSSRWWKLGDPERVADDGGANSIFWFFRGEATGWSVAERWSGGSELVSAPWEISMTWHDGVAMSNAGDAAPGRKWMRWCQLGWHKSY
jgi:hypothetical protein